MNEFTISQYRWYSSWCTIFCTLNRDCFIVGLHESLVLTNSIQQHIYACFTNLVIRSALSCLLSVSHTFRTLWNLYVCVKVRVKCSRYKPGVAQRVGRRIALLFHDRGTRREWVVSSTLRPHFTPGKTRYPFYKRLGGPRAGLDGRNFRPHRDSIPDRPARSLSLYRLRYTQITLYHCGIFHKLG